MAIRLNPKEANTYHNRGYSQAELGEYDLAIADYSEALKRDPKLKYANYRRGWAYSAKGDQEKALADYNIAAERTPDDPDILNDRGHSYAQLSDLDKAQAHFREGHLAQRTTRLLMPIAVGCWRSETSTMRPSSNIARRCASTPAMPTI